MPATLTYPGVYIEEIPSGVRTITGVATSVTAFVGGLDEVRSIGSESPVTINSFGDFELLFGGLWSESTMSYAVRDFYLNGGSQAIVVRLHNGATKATITVAGGLSLQARSVGLWGEQLRVRVDTSLGLMPNGSTPICSCATPGLGTGRNGALNFLIVPNRPQQLDKFWKPSKLVRLEWAGGNALTKLKPRRHANPTPG